MPRQARIVLPGKLHHVTQRGNHRQNVFYEDKDRIVYLKYINENAKEYGLDIYVYCLMDNHVHFIVKPNNVEALAKTFRVTHQRYSLYLNRKFGQLGHCWQSRYYSCVILGSHIRTAVRYVERNPVRANIVDRPWDYSWSSAKFHLGKYYKIIELANIKEYINVPSWKRFLMEEGNSRDEEILRKSTFQGKIFGPLVVIKRLEKSMKRSVMVRQRGRPRKG